MKKQGFTLIELMVVIVIMGILAAVAVPKLFGMIAKSKASELGPAAGEYIKLQDAYVSEAGTYAGGWTKIGYVMEKTNNFEYKDPSNVGAGTVAIGAADAEIGTGWQASNLANLNECAKGGTWDVKLTSGGAGTTSPIKYAAEISSNACYILAPSFDQLTKGNITVN